MRSGYTTSKILSGVVHLQWDSIRSGCTSCRIAIGVDTPLISRGAEVRRGAPPAPSPEGDL
eukprot:7380592-Pyramimonas_sp.AAC.1